MKNGIYIIIDRMRSVFKYNYKYKLNSTNKYIQFIVLCGMLYIKWEIAFVFQIIIQVLEREWIKKPKTKNKTCFWWIFKTKVKKNWTKKNRNLHQFYMPYLKISMEVGLKKRIWIFDINIFKYNQSNAVNFATHAVVTCSFFLYKRNKIDIR